jgi:hypothetical protein
MVSAPIAGHNAQIYITSGTSITLTDEAMTDSGDHMTFNDSTVAHQAWDTSAATTVQAKWDDVQTVTVTGVPTSGNFTLIWNTHTTGTIAFNASAATMQAALVALTGVGSGQVLVTGSAGGPWTIDWTGTLAYASQPLPTLGTNSLTGGTSPNVAFARLQAGQGFTTVTSGFVINYPIGQVVFTSVLLGATPVVRLHAGKYFTFSFMAYANTVSPAMTATTIDVTSFTNPVSPWKQFIIDLLGATIKLGKFWIDGTFLAHLTTADLLILQIYPGQNANQRFQGYGILTSDAIKSAQNTANTEDLNFVVNGQLYFIPS